MPVKIDEGWEIAPGDECDRKVCLQHSWSSHALVFADGDAAATSIRLSSSSWYGRQAWKAWHSRVPFNHFLVRQGAVVSATDETYDVLLRRLS